MRKKLQVILINIFFIAVTSFFIKAGCSKEDVRRTDAASLSGTWRIESHRYGQDSTNANAWNPVNYNKITQIIELYCVNDSRVGQSFISRVNCAYDITGGTSVGVVASDCARSIFRKDTTWYQQTKYDIAFSSDYSFNWLELFRFSTRINTINQPCSPIAYLPESENQYEANGQWLLDETNQVITVNYSPGYSRIDAEQINRFRITGFTGNTITLKLIGSSGDEWRLKKL